LFILSAIVFIVAHYSKYQLVCDISKPIPLIILLLLIKWNSKHKLLIAFGLIFSLIGDIILERFKWFIPGLVAFLIAHIFYIIAFVRRSGKPSLLSGIPFYAYGILMFLLLFKTLGEMAIPVAFYILIITTMLWRAYVQRNIDKASMWALWGAVLFTISDSVLAFNRFYEAFYIAPLLIMITY
jgi:alkenylglycerophosphocholine hydrolase